MGVGVDSNLLDGNLDGDLDAPDDMIAGGNGNGKPRSSQHAIDLARRDYLYRLESGFYEKEVEKLRK